MQFQVLAALALPAIVSSLVIHVPHPRPVPTWVEDKVHSVEHKIATKIHKIKDDVTSVIAVEKSIWTTPPAEWTTPPAIPDKWTTPPAVPTIVWDDNNKRDESAKLNERLVIHVPHPPKVPEAWQTPPPVPTFEWDDKVKRDQAEANLNERLVITVPKIPAAWHTPPPVPTFEWDDKVKRDQAEAKLNERLIIHVPHPPKVPAAWHTPPPVPTFEWDDKVKRSNTLNARWEFGLDESCVEACTNAHSCTVDSYTTLHDLTHCGSDTVSCAADCFSWGSKKVKAKRSEEDATLNERLVVHVPHAPTWEEINDAIPDVPDWTPPAVPDIAPPAVPTIVWDNTSNKARRANLQARWSFGLDESCVHSCVDNADCTVNSYTTLHALASCGADAVSCAADCFSWSN